VILTTLYLTGAKKHRQLGRQEGGLHRAFPLDVPMILSPKLSFITNDNNPTSVGLALGSAIHFDSLKFITNRFGHLSLSL
jgi:hypothetical protein